MSRFLKRRPDAHWFALCVICLLPIVLYVPFLTEPFQNDEGLYAYVGRLLLHGDLPYRDAFDNKPPAVFAWYALSFLLFGEHVWAPRLLVAILLSVTTALVYFQGRLVWSARAGLIAAFAFAASMGVARIGVNANTEYFLVLPMTAGLVAYTLGRRRGSGGWYLLSGVFNGIAVITKETALFPFGSLIIFHLFAQPKGGSGRRALAEEVWLLTGALLVGLLTILPFLVSRTFDDFWNAGVVYTLRYASDTSTVGRVFGTIFPTLFLTLVAGPWIMLSALAVLRARKSPQPAEYWLIISWLAASYAGIVVVGRFYSHYFFQLLPGMALLAPPGLAYLRDKWRKADRGYLLLPATIVALGAIAVLLSANVYARASPESRHIAKYPNDTLAEFEADSPRLGEYIRQNTTTDDLIYNLGFQTELYFYADRESPTKFILDRPFATDSEYVVQAERDLAANPPKYIIDSARYDPWEPGRYDDSGLRSFIADRYEYLGKIYYADVYRLRQ